MVLKFKYMYRDDSENISGQFKHPLDMLDEKVSFFSRAYKIIVPVNYGCQLKQNLEFACCILNMLPQLPGFALKTFYGFSHCEPWPRTLFIFLG